MLSRKPTPHVSLSSRFNAENDEEISDSIEGVCGQLWLKRACLQRDGGRCVVSGYYDLKDIMRLPPDQRVQNRLTCETEAAHIVPFSLGSSVVRISYLSFKTKAEELILNIIID